MELLRKDAKLEDLCYSGVGEAKIPPSVFRKFIKAINTMRVAKDMSDIYSRTGFHCESLKGKLLWKKSIKLNQSRRLIFSISKQWDFQGIVIEAINNHYSK